MFYIKMRGNLWYNTQYIIGKNVFMNFIKTFNELDKNSDGRLTVDELSAGLQ